MAFRNADTLEAITEGILLEQSTWPLYLDSNELGHDFVR